MIPDKYITRVGLQTKVRLAQLTGVQYAAWMQDWPIEVADPRRVEEFLHVYESEALNSEEKRALMMLVLCSFDECDECSEQTWAAIRGILVAEARLHAGLIIYWSCVVEGEDDSWCFELDEHVFCLTPRMRPVLRQVMEEIDFRELKADHPDILRDDPARE